MKKKPEFLMCRPAFYTIAYEINPWMDLNNPADHRNANRQWQYLYNLIENSGADISLIEPVKDLPDMVFTANAGLVYKDSIILSNFKHRERQGEEQYYAKWFSDLGYKRHRLQAGISYEGEGDTVFYKNIILLGYGFRTDLAAHTHIGEIIGKEYISLELIDPHFYHLDTCLLYIKPADLIVYYPEAFHPKSIEIIKGLPSKILQLSKEEAHLFVCNSVNIGMNLIVFKCPDTLSKKLEEFGLKIISADTSEFMKSGGSVRCMVLRLS